MKKLYLFVICLVLGSADSIAQRLPYQIENNSEFPDNEVFVAVVGEIGGFVWVDPVNGQINQMSRADNTVPGPVNGGNLGPGQDGRYANCFRRLSDIPNRTVNVPQIAGCRILISFRSQLYLYFFGFNGAPSGYAAPNLENPTDPNQGIRFESIELTLNEFGIFNNTSRVDAFQYPIGLEVEGVNFFKKVGELKPANEILDEWERTAPPAFQGLLKRDEGIIKFPTKDASFPTNYLDGYIDAIWAKYRNEELYFNSGDAGRWRGRVQGNNFVFNRESDGQVATIPGKPSTLEAMEGSGVMASGQRWDLVVQAQFVAAITRHAIDLNVPSGVFQDFGDSSKYYQVEPFNWYSKFFHRTDISFESQTYTFAYDDVFNQSSTISTGQPTRAKITLGPINGGGTPPPPPPPSGNIETWTSANIAGNVIRHQNGRVRIDANVNPATDGQWRMLPGLAGQGISFRSVNFPNSYLRHRDSQVWLDPLQNNDTYSRDATYFIRPGLSNGSLSSFESFNFPGRYLRHRNSLFFLETINSDLDRRDATFSRNGGGGQNPGNSLQIEAENYTAFNDVQTEPSSEGGENVGFINNGSFMAYADINFPSSGNYLIEYRVASAIGGGRFSSDLNAGSTVLGELSVPNTGGWQNWTTISQTVNINAGTYQFGLFSISGGWNINWIRITAQGNAEALTASLETETTNNSVLYPNPFIDSVTLKTDDDNSVISVVDMQGREVVAPQNVKDGERLFLSELQKGMYFVKIKTPQGEETQRLLKD